MGHFLLPFSKTTLHLEKALLATNAQILGSYRWKGLFLHLSQTVINTEDDENRQLGNVIQNLECPHKIHLQL